MTITCEHCKETHELAEEAVPLYGARLRCTGCGQLFDVTGREGVPREPEPVLPARRAQLRIPPVDSGSVNDLESNEMVGQPHAEVEVGAANGVDPDLEAKRLARVLLTDVVYADPERFEAARREGRVLLEYAPEIGRAWSFYQHRVGAAYATASSHFRSALREVMGGSG